MWGWGGKEGRAQPSPHGLSPNPPLAGRLGGGASLQPSCARGRREGGWTARSGFGRGLGGGTDALPAEELKVGCSREMRVEKL